MNEILPRQNSESFPSTYPVVTSAESNIHELLRNPRLLEAAAIRGKQRMLEQDEAAKRHADEI